MSQAQELPAAPSAVTALSGAEASAAASHSSDGNAQHSFGGQVSPRAARSQVSTAVSFEGARAAGSAALPSRSLEGESALSAAEGDVEYSHSAEPNQAAAGGVRPIRDGRLRPSNSLMSTAVQPASPHMRQPVSPRLNRANSVVSHTAPGGRQHGGRAGTPASAYGQGQGFLLPNRARQQSPVQPLGIEQVEQQTAAAAAAGQHQPAFAQLPPAWQHMPPAFPGLQDMTGQGRGQQTATLQSTQHQQHLNGMHVLEQRDSFDGHHRSSDNGGGRRHRNLGHRAVGGFTGQQAAGTANGSATGDAAEHQPPAAAAALQPGTGGLQPNMQLFQNALAALPTAVAGGLLQGLLGQAGMGLGSVQTQFFAAPAAATATTDGAAAAAYAAGVDDNLSRQRSPTGAAGSAGGMPTDLLQQLQVQMTPALLAMLQGQASSNGHGHSQQVPGLPYTPQQLQQALSLLLAGLASQAGQYGIVLPGVGGGPAAAVQQQLPVPPGAAGMRPPPVPPVQAKSCDSSIAGGPASRQRGPTAAVAGGAVASPVVPLGSQPLCLSAAAAAAVHMSAQDIAAQPGVQQHVPEQILNGTTVTQQLQSPWLQQQHASQHLHWRSPSPSPAPIGLAAARTSAAGEGHGSLNLGGLGSACLHSQHGVDAAARATSSAGGASRAGGGLTSEEGEADAPAAVAANAAACPPDDADQQGSIGGAGQEEGSQPHGDGTQQGATSPNRRQQHHAHGQIVAAAAAAGHEQHQHHARQQPSVHEGEHVNPTTSVHATLMSEGNQSGSRSDADSEQSSTHSGGSNSNRGAAAGEQHQGAVGEVVSQPCGASYSASPPPSASMPAVATATGPASRSVLGGSGSGGCSRDAAAAVGSAAVAEPAAGVRGRAATAAEGQHQIQQPSAHAQHEGDAEQQAQQEQQQHRDSSLAMATAGPAGTRSGTVSTNSGTVDMSIHNESQRSGAGSQGEAPAAGGWAADDELQDAVNSRDGDARGEPPGAYETAESGRAADNGYQEHGQHVQQHHAHEQQHQHVPAGSPVPEHSAAGLGGRESAHGSSPGHAGAAAGITHASYREQQQRREQRQSVRFATASTPGDGCIGSPSLQGAYSSSDMGIPGASAAGHIGAVPPRQSSAAGNLTADEAVPGAYGSDHGFSVADEVDAGSMLLPGTADGAAHGAQGDSQGLGLAGLHGQLEPAAAQHAGHVALHAAFSVTSQLQPAGRLAAGAALGHAPQQGHHHRHRQQQENGPDYGCNRTPAPHAQGRQHGHAALCADAVPQVTEIYGQFANHSAPATAAAAQMAAAAAGHAQPQPDVHPQVTEMHGMLGASAGTAAGALLAAAAANGHMQSHAYSPGAAAAAAAAGLGATGSTIGDGGLPPLPHMHSVRAHHSYHQRPQFPAAGSSKTGAAASTYHIAGTGLNAVSPPSAAQQYGGQWGSNHHTHGQRAASADTLQFGTHSRAHHSPPAVNFNPTAQGIGLANGTSQTMPYAVPAIVLAAAAPPAAADGVIASVQLHLEQQQLYPSSPTHAQGNSQLGQQDGSRGSPPAGMGRVGSVPPLDQGAAAGGGELGVVEQALHRSHRTLSEDAGSHHQAADDAVPQYQQQIEQEADGPSHAAGLSRQQPQEQGDSRSAVTSPAQQRRRHANAFASAAAVAAADGVQLEPPRQLQQHWQQQQGTVNEGAGQVGGRAASMRFSLGQPEGSIAAGISSKIYGSVSAGFASGSKAEGSPSYGAGLDGCSCGNAMASGANGYHGGDGQQQQDNEHDNQQQAHSHSTRRRGRSRESPAGAAAAAAAALQEGEGSHGSRSQEVPSCKRQRTSCEAASVQQQPRMTSSMQTTEA
eukprot:GHUV01003246.1.p1 GENE.GHUV01003246.1~~GHUV01003246.1.p1  ORF type:complete len:1830 (+),score=721.09 GHUV01003246.1:181-5670(+)